MQVTGIGWAAVLTEDFESTLQFFSEVLGLFLAYRDDPKELAHFRFPSGQLFEVYGPRNRQRKEKYQWFHGPVLGFEVSDVRVARQEMIARGAKFITELETWEDDMWSLFLGPQETLFEILRPTRKPAHHFGNVSGICSGKFFVQDLADAMKFFSHVMEMSSVKPGEGEIARFSLPGGHMFEVVGSSGHPLLTIGFAVDDIARARHQMEIRGMEFIGPVEGMREGAAQSRFCGPDQYIYELVYDPDDQFQGE